MKAVESLIQKMRRDVALNPGATPSELDSLRNLLRIELPDDVRRFYSLANGMPDLMFDRNAVEFWSIQKMQGDSARWSANEVGFADFLLDSWHFLFRTSPQGLVVVTTNVAQGTPFGEIGTFSTFCEIYIRSPQDLGL